ncbi:MAG: DUF3267 domain-containing protein [Bacilli bacterium]|nr:DUF3267 domain-containing protein [Bacilli bacterium]
MKKKELKYYTYKLDLKVLNILSIILFVIVGGIIFFIERHDNYVLELDVIGFIILIFVWLIVHELLHAVGFMIFKEVKKTNLTFGMFLEKGIFYVMCKQNIGRRVILTSLCFPIVIIGFITLIIGMSINSFMLVYLSIMNIVASIGDIVMIIYFIKAPRDIIYLDLDDPTSFTVVSNEDLSYINVVGIEMVEKGKYDNKMKAKDRRRLIISKWSYILLIFLAILFMIRIVGGKML